MSVQRRGPHVGLLVLVLCSLSLPLLVAQPAHAGHDWAPIKEHYSLDSNCIGETDPIGVVIFGDGITGEKPAGDGAVSHQLVPRRWSG